MFADSDAVHWLASFAKQHLSALPRRQKIVSLYARLGHGVLSACAGGFNMSASLDAELPISMAPRSSWLTLAIGSSFQEAKTLTLVWSLKCTCVDFLCQGHKKVSLGSTSSAVYHVHGPSRTTLVCDLLDHLTWHFKGSSFRLAWHIGCWELLASCDIYTCHHSSLMTHFSRGSKARNLDVKSFTRLMSRVFKVQLGMVASMLV